MSRELDDTVNVESLGGAVSSTPSELPVGELFAERYRVEGMLGRGGMGAVYRVRDVKLDEVVALKLLTLEGEVAVERFLREVRLARRVTHPSVARTHDFGEHEGVRFLTMELVEGGTLEDLLDRSGGILPPVRVAALGAAIAEGLAAAHAAGVVHRDLKPGNILLAANERVVITDFGIARATSGEQDGKRTQVVGTPTYMAPEQVSGGKVDARTDIYALGAMLFELVTGAVPFEGEDAIAVAVARLREEPPDPRQFANVPDALANLITRCMAREPEARPANAVELRYALAALATSDRPGSATTPRGVSVSGLYAPVTTAREALAVLPFVYRGAAEHDYLGEGLAEELIDVLSRTQGLKVLSLGATRRYSDNRDPRAIGDDLRATAVVDGTVQLAGDRVRLAARLIETEDGAQRWSDRFDGKFEDVFTLQDQMGKRLAEALRVELAASTYGKTAPQEAIELYLRARKMLRSDLMVQAEDAVALLDRSLELAPGFAMAIAAHAMATVKAWWGTERDSYGRRRDRALESVERAVTQVPDLAETHQARAMLAVQSGEFRTAALALGRALEIAPTMAESHHYLGDLQMEAGREKEGRRRLALALELDPSLHICHMMLARDALFNGQRDAYEGHRAAIDRAYPTLPLAILFAHFRWALYDGDHEAAKAVRDAIASLSSEAGQRLAVVANMAFQDCSSVDVQPLVAQVQAWLSNQRFTTLIQQIMVEVFCVSGAREQALSVLEQAAGGILLDIGWIRSCPLLADIRRDPRFVEVERVVAQRAADVWRR